MTDKLIDHDALCRMTDRLVASSANVHAVLVARGGKLVFERYFKGSDEINGRRVESDVAFDADTPHNIKSAAYSVASLVLGIAIDRGLIPKRQRTDLQLLPRVVRFAFPREGPHPVGTPPRRPAQVSSAMPRRCCGPLPCSTSIGSTTPTRREKSASGREVTTGKITKRAKLTANISKPINTKSKAAFSSSSMTFQNAVTSSISSAPLGVARGLDQQQQPAGDRSCFSQRL